MNKQELEKLLKGYQNIKVGKNQIYLDGELFVVEKFEYVDNGVDMFSVVDGFENIEDAIRVAKTL